MHLLPSVHIFNFTFGLIIVFNTIVLISVSYYIWISNTIDNNNGENSERFTFILAISWT